MKQKIPCICENTFSVEAPEEINLDEQPEYIEEILSGRFMSFTCPGCGKINKPEFPLTLLWPAKNLRMEVLPEQDRILFYRRKKDTEKKETIIGYPEMADRIAVLRDELEPAAVESLKYFLILKAEETYPDMDISIWYQRRNTADLEFHIHGLKQGEVAISRVPLAVYEKTLTDFKSHQKSEVFSALRVSTYLSVSNLMRPGA